jgi:Tfp pilus assembly protein PilW
MNMPKFSFLNFKKLRGEEGFTIVELLVTTLVFSIMVVAISSIFVQIINDERRALAAQSIQENGQFILELMSREIRVSKIVNQESPNCNATSLTITHPVNGTVTYTLTAGGVLQRTASGTTSDLSNSTITFSRLNFCVKGSGAIDLQQPRVAILASIQNKVGKEILKFNLQTTVTSRDVQSEFEQ